MTKYDNIFNSGEELEELLSPEEAVAAIAVITTAVDTSPEDIDAESLAYILLEFEIFAGYIEEEILDIVDKLIAIAQSQGLGTLFNTANSSLDDETVLDAFAAGVILLLDDETLTIPKQQQPYLERLQGALGLEDEEAEEIIQEVVDAIQEEENGEYEDEYEIVLDSDELSSSVGDRQIYESPMNNFKLIAPVDTEEGGRINSQEGTVSFTDDLGTFLRIDHYLLPPEQLDEIELIGSNTYLESLLLYKYVPQAIIANLPEASVKYVEYLPDILEGAYFILIDMPKGSTISKPGNNGTGIRLDAYRGTIAFVNGEFLYIVSTQHSFFDGNIPGEIEAEAEYLKTRILDFIDTIEFMEL